MDKQRKKHDHTPPIDWADLNALTTPDERWLARTERRAQAAREVPYRCAWGRCVNYYDPETHRITWGYGAVGCPCDLLPGWDGRHPEMLAKPAWPAKSGTGRHGSRVQRSRRRHREVGASGYMVWAEEWM